MFFDILNKIKNQDLHTLPVPTDDEFIVLIRFSPTHDDVIEYLLNNKYVPSNSIFENKYTQEIPLRLLKLLTNYNIQVPKDRFDVYINIPEAIPRLLDMFRSILDEDQLERAITNYKKKYPNKNINLNVL